MLFFSFALLLSAGRSHYNEPGRWDSYLWADQTDVCNAWTTSWDS